MKIKPIAIVFTNAVVGLQHTHTHTHTTILKSIISLDLPYPYPHLIQQTMVLNSLYPA